MASPLDRSKFDPKLSGIHFEKHGIVSGLTRAIVIPICNLLCCGLGRFSDRWGGKIGRWLFTFGGAGNDAERVAETVKTYEALEIMYNFWERRRLGLSSVSDNFWQQVLSNGRSLRNRLMLTEFLLKRAKDDVLLRTDSPRFASLACGSARATIDRLAENGHNGAHAYLLDQSSEALSYAKRLAEEKGVFDEITLIEGNIVRVKSALKPYLISGNGLDVVEAVGILDYLNDRIAISMFRQAYDLLNPSGYLVTCNVCPNLEQPFVTKGIGWDGMVYRTADDLTGLLVQSRFSPENIMVIPEPLGVHLLVVAKKD